MTFDIGWPFIILEQGHRICTQKYLLQRVWTLSGWAIRQIHVRLLLGQKEFWQLTIWLEVVLNYYDTESICNPTSSKGKASVKAVSSQQPIHFSSAAAIHKNVAAVYCTIHVQVSTQVKTAIWQTSLNIKLKLLCWVSSSWPIMASIINRIWCSFWNNGIVYRVAKNKTPDFFVITQANVDRFSIFYLYHTSAQ